MKLSTKNKVVALVAVLSACIIYIFLNIRATGIGNVKLNDNFEKIEFTKEFNQEELKKRSEEVVKIISACEFDKLTAISDKDLVKSMEADKKNTEEQYKFLRELMGKAGKLEKINISQMDCYKIKKTKQEMALVRLKVKYEHKKIVYILFFNKDNELMAFNIK